MLNLSSHLSCYRKKNLSDYTLLPNRTGGWTLKKWLKRFCHQLVKMIVVLFHMWMCASKLFVLVMILTRSENLIYNSKLVWRDWMVFSWNWVRLTIQFVFFPSTLSLVCRRNNTWIPYSVQVGVDSNILPWKSHIRLCSFSWFSLACAVVGTTIESTTLFYNRKIEKYISANVEYFFRQGNSAMFSQLSVSVVLFLEFNKASWILLNYFIHFWFIFIHVTLFIHFPCDA